jgi:histidyl-tRNA synthetase
MNEFRRPTGTQDFLPEVQAYWEHVIAVTKELAWGYGFERIDVPIFEETQLFARGVGEATDVVEKEMYSFRDKGENPITLRPEFTAGVVRAYIENGMRVLPKPIKLFSIGPVFRYERPQAGRFRQFHQFNAEIFGVEGPLADLEVMLLAWELFEGLSFEDLSFQLNSTGCPECRPGFVAHLVEHYREHYEVICEDCRRRLEENPLRVLDCKQEVCQPVIAGAPKITEELCEECAEHFAALRRYLDELDKPYTINDRLVRGLDYYTKTVFEVWAEGIGAQAAVAGGGRYDGLVELLGGTRTPAVGFATGLERIVMVMEAQGIEPPPLPTPPAFVAHLGKASRPAAVQLVTEVREAGIEAQIAMTGSLRSQLRTADRKGARYVLLLGGDEIERGVVQVKDLVDGGQEEVPRDEVIERLRDRLEGEGGS